MPRRPALTGLLAVLLLMQWGLVLPDGLVRPATALAAEFSAPQQVRQIALPVDEDRERGGQPPPLLVQSADPPPRPSAPPRPAPTPHCQPRSPPTS